MTTKIYYRDSSKDMYEDVPDTTKPKFDVVVIENDLTFDIPADTTAILYYSRKNKNLWASALSAAVSGNTPPKNGLFYNTNANIIRRYESNAPVDNFCSFPLALVTTTGDGVTTSIDQVFNGFGYIGSTVFALPGVKGLIPNGRNNDGSLKSIEFTVSKLITFNMLIGNTYEPQMLLFDSALNIQGPTQIGTISYNEADNYTTYNGTNQSWLPIITFVYNNNKITSFTPKTVFHAVDYNDVVHKTGDETISGLKTFDNNIVYKKSTYDFSKIPTNNIYTEIRNLDVNGFEIGQFRVWKDTDGANVIDLLGRYQHGTANVYGAHLGVKTYANGTSFAYTNAKDINNSIVTTVNKSKAQNGYFKFGNGMIIQWGKGAATNSYTNVQTITLPIAFSNTNYSITFGTLLTKQNTKCEKMFHIQNKTTTNFQAYCSYTGGTNNTTVSPTWIAIGY